MVVSRHQNAGQSHNLLIADRSVQNMTKFKNLETTTNENRIHEEITSRLNSGNAYYHSLQNLLSFRLLSKNLEIKIYKIIIFLSFFLSTGFYSPLRTLACLDGLLDPQTFGRTPWLEDQSNARKIIILPIIFVWV
jgi:hypothetical protein